MIAGFIAKLLADSAVTAYVGARVYPKRRPQATPLPCLVCHGVSGAPIYTSDGESGLFSRRAQIDCWATTYTEAKRIADVVKTSLSGYVGTSAGIDFRSCLLETEQDFDEGGGNAPQYEFRVNLDFMVLYREA